MKKIVINARREGYATDQISQTMTIGELVEMFEELREEYGDETPVYIGNDPQSYGWYTYGGIREYDIYDNDRLEDEFEE